jgi:hypothetical protein
MPCHLLVLNIYPCLDGIVATVANVDIAKAISHIA